MAIIHGTNYNDNGTWQFISPTWRWFGVLNGSAESDTIYGYAGNDKLYVVKTYWTKKWSN